MSAQNKTKHPVSLKVEAVRALEFSNRLHSTLDLEKMMSLYTEHTQDQIAFDHISYQHPDNLFSYEDGKRQRHACRYRLLMGGQNLGELEFTRARKFNENEMISLEYSMSSLLNPLHNGLMYHQARLNSLLDPLTGISNRSAFDHSLSREVSLSRRHHTPLTMIMLDIDKFKEINDNHGHLFGDCVLRDVAQAIKQQIRDSDMAFRYGGEEFAILLSNTCIDGAQLLAERIRQYIASRPCSFNDTSVNITVSLGVACLEQEESENGFFQRADKALYEAKNNGRNCTRLAKT